MARLKRGNLSYSAEGLAKKYELPTVQENIRPHSKKKNTKKWCRGKVGAEHELQRYFYKVYTGNVYRKSNWIRTRCTVCYKQFHANNPSVPLKIDLHETNENEVYPVQVKVNGVAIPIDYKLFHTDYYCWACMEWHSKY